MKGITERQHYVPEFYLRHFSGNEGRLCVYRRDGNRYFQASPEDICNKRYLYESKMGEDGEFFRANDVEKKLSKKESDFPKMSG